MKILGIETSCDETAAAVVRDGTKILSNITATSAGIHARTGGVIPEDAARKQIAAIIPVTELAIKDAGMDPSKIDAIAITSGPGLIGSLIVGVETAKTLSYLWKKPIVPVNHLVAHIYANWLATEELKNLKTKKPEFPALALVVSGGHTDLVLMKGHPSTSSGSIEWLGGTRDDAAGEAFDKTARLLGIPYPGGPGLAREADEFLNNNPGGKLNLFPRPILDETNFDWSFSGLKTSVLKKLTELGIVDQQKNRNVRLSDYKKVVPAEKQKIIPFLAAEVQEAIVDSLVIKTIRAVQKYKPKSLLLAGGVAANSRLREKITDEIKTKKIPIMFHVPEIKLCTDNATYIAAYAHFNFKPANWKKIEANPELTIMGQV